MKTYYIKKISKSNYEGLYKRPAIDTETSFNTVKPILKNVKKYGLNGALKYARKYEEFTGNQVRVTQDELNNGIKNIPQDLKDAISIAFKNIYSFHYLQKPKGYSIETMPGVKCSRVFRPIENVGLYIPGGNAVLFSSLLMMAVPAIIAGCKRITVFSPARKNVLSNELLYAASVCGITEIYKIGGAQAVALMAYGDKSIPKVDKIFGPGNQYVTAAKTLVGIDTDGCTTDMPAGPSEVLIIADRYANPEYIAADLLSQAEHGNDSQVILVTNSKKIAAGVKKELKEERKYSIRKKEISNSLKSSFILITETLEDAFDFSNRYAPEHLILNIKNAGRYTSAISNAGSVFLGEYSPESAGDYASGTNHSLPTYGYVKSFSGLTVEQFMKSITLQKLTRRGLQNIAKTIITMSEAEALQAHANAVRVRLIK